jgi:hypothetical protein
MDRAADVPARGVGKIVDEMVGRTALKHARISLLIAGGLFLFGWTWVSMAESLHDPIVR